MNPLISRQAVGRTDNKARCAWDAHDGIDLVFVFAAAQESDAARLHVGSVAENVGRALGRSNAFGLSTALRKTIG
jgi:hypothetical protein